MPRDTEVVPSRWQPTAQPAVGFRQGDRRRNPLSVRRVAPTKNDYVLRAQERGLFR